jgi:hypothetical protein
MILKAKVHESNSRVLRIERKMGEAGFDQFMLYACVCVEKHTEPCKYVQLIRANQE